MNKMNSAISLIFFLIFLSSPLVGQEAAEDTANRPTLEDWIKTKAIVPAGSEKAASPVKLTKARIKFDEIDFDFGSLAKGAKVSHNYWFTNEGKDTLIITQVKPTCGCTSTKKNNIVVPPGGRSSIDVIFDSGRFNGRVTKGIKIECNDELNPFLELRFKANINNPLQIIEFSPLEADFKEVSKGKKAEMKLSLTNTDSSLINLTLIETPSPDFIKVTLGNQKLKPNQSTELKIELGKNISEGPFVSSVTLQADGRPDSRITIPILGKIVAGSPAAKSTK